MHTSSEEEDFLWRRGQQPSSSTTTSAEENKETKPDKKHAKAFTFAVFHSQDLPHEQYFAVKGEKRHGLLIEFGCYAWTGNFTTTGRWSTYHLHG